MKVPCGLVCQTRYNEEERVPLLLQCGHRFCKECLSRIFSASPDISLPCPRHRHMSLVGNSIQALKKNYGVLALLDPNPNSAGSNSRNDFVYTDEKENDDGGKEGWQCKHKVVVKKVGFMEGMDGEWVQGQFESLRRVSMWCRNVCTFHGVVRFEESNLGIVMDRYHWPIQSTMLNNEGRLTLEQVLRCGVDIARGVAELHAAGVVCMNIKPYNLLLDASGHAVISDYGLAAILKKPGCRKARTECDS